MLPIKIEGFRLAEKREIVDLDSYTNASKCFCERRLGFSNTEKYMENQNLNLRFSSRGFNC